MSRRASWEAFLANLRQPMPLARKWRLIVRNRLRFPPQPVAAIPASQAADCPQQTRVRAMTTQVDTTFAMR